MYSRGRSTRIIAVLAAAASVIAVSAVGNGSCSGPVIGWLMAVKLARAGAAVGGRVEAGRGLAAVVAVAAIYMSVSF